MVRDLLPKLQQRLNAFSWESTESLIIKHNEIRQVFEKTPMGVLLSMYSKILQEIYEIETNLNTLKSMVEIENIKNFNEIEMTKLRRKNVYQANQIMSKFQNIGIYLPPQEQRTSLARMKRGLYHGLFQHFMLIWSQCEEFMQCYEQNLKNDLKEELKIMNYNLDDDELEDWMMVGEVSMDYTRRKVILDDWSVVGEVRQVTEEDLQPLQDRLEALNKLEESIEEMHALFLRLPTLVISQSETLQSIEKHYNDAENYIEKANNSITNAEEAVRKKTKNKKMILFSAVIFIFFIIIVIA